MSGFSADWLALRSAADARARNRDVAAALSAAFSGRRGLGIVDVGAGTGANLRATAPLLPLRQHWVLVDRDPDLLARIDAPEGVSCETLTVDLSDGLPSLFDPAPDLVTASAFFDLAGESWLAAFVDALVRARVPLYAVLSYDGTERWDGEHPADAEVLAAFHADQRRDKGLGPALGPDAHGALAGLLTQAGYEVVEGRSDWCLEASRDRHLIAALAEGAAEATAPTLGETARAWGEARRSASAVTIGHRDLLALPPA